MQDHRIEPVLRAVCKFYKICDCESGCAVDINLVLEIIRALDKADKELGIVRVAIEPNSTQSLVGLRCAIRQESHNIIYKEMVRSGIIKNVLDDANGSIEP